MGTDWSRVIVRAPVTPKVAGLEAYKDPKAAGLEIREVRVGE